MECCCRPLYISPIGKAVYAARWRPPVGGVTSAVNIFRHSTGPGQAPRILLEDIRRVLADEHTALPEEKIFPSVEEVTGGEVREFLQILQDVLEGRRLDPRDELKQCEQALQSNPNDAVRLRRKEELLRGHERRFVLGGPWNIIFGFGMETPLGRI